MRSRQTRPNRSRRRKGKSKDSPARRDRIGLVAAKRIRRIRPAMLPTRPRTLYVARVSTRRNALALAFASLAVGALLAVRPLASSSGRFGETLGFETFLAMLALAFAARSPRGITERLGLGPSELPRGALALLALGTLALSYSLDGIYRLIEPPGQRRAVSIRVRARRSPRRNACLRAAELRAGTGYRRGNPLPRSGTARPPNPIFDRYLRSCSLHSSSVRSTWIRSTRHSPRFSASIWAPSHTWREACGPRWAVMSRTTPPPSSARQPPPESGRCRLLPWSSPQPFP